MISPQRLVVFDLGRVLIRICDHWQDACRVAGIPPPWPTLDALSGQQLHAAVVEHETGRSDLAAFSRQAADAVGTEPSTVVAISDAFVRGPFSGSVALLDDLRSRGISTACLSNVNDNHWRIIQDPSLPAFFPLDRFTHRFASHLVGARKPDPAIYHAVELATGLAGDRLVFFDDMPENVDAARTRGWDAHVVTDRSDPVSQVRGILGLALP